MADEGERGCSPAAETSAEGRKGSSVEILIYVEQSKILSRRGDTICHPGRVQGGWSVLR